MFDNQERDLRSEVVDTFKQLFNHRWGQALERFIHQNHFHIATQRSGNGNHLLFATRKRICPRMKSIFDSRKFLDNTLHWPSYATIPSALQTANFQVFFYC